MNMKICTITVNCEKEVVDMNEAKEIKVMSKMISSFYQKKASKKEAPKTRRTRNYRTKVNSKLVNMEPVPCSADEVFSLGVSLQYYIGAIYLELAESNQGPHKVQYKDLALGQLEGKVEIEKLAKDNLNRLLTYFYNNGGPIIERPVSELMSKGIQPFFNRIVANFLDQVNALVQRVTEENISASQLEETINNYIITMYTSMCKLFLVDEIQTAFKELIGVREDSGYLQD
jgi:hypothetical protein